MQEINKKKHGGVRVGAGRKANGHGKYYGFNSTVEVQSILESLTTSKTEYINSAILFYTEHLKGLG